MSKKYDICGWATKFNIKCADGRTIKPGAFDDCDGKTVPLVWQHLHDEPKNVLGHCVLEKRGKDGMYTYAYFNDSKEADDAKIRIKNGDINCFSIYANHLTHAGSNVTHGTIREVSLVLSGANPGALIEFPIIEHADGSEADDEAVIYTNANIEHAPFLQPVQQPTPMPVITHSAVPTTPVIRMPANYIYNAPIMHAAVQQGGTNMPERTVRDVFNTLNEEQKNVLYFILGEMIDQFGGSEGGDSMKHNVFEGDTPMNTISHDDMKQIMTSGIKKAGTLSAAIEDYYGDSDIIAHSVYNSDGSEQTYGIADIDMLFPEYRNLNNPPDWIKRDTDWVGVVMNGVHKTPFSRIKSQYANITMDEARAKGYVKGKKKIEEVFSLLRRTTDPQTIYKKQKLDRDDILDITDFDVVAWIKGEMRVMLDEEIARAILVGDGRLSTDDDKIMENHVRPIWGDDDLYVIRANVQAGTDDAATAKAIIRKIIKSRKDYKGSGNLTFFTTEDWLTEMLLLEDDIGHPLYADSAAVARKLRVNRIVTAPVMENLAKGNEKLVGIIVDLKDYNVGADKGASVHMFEDFDIDYNQEKYLIETRMSGALITPYSAIVVTVGGADYAYNEVETPTGNPNALGYYEKNGTIYTKSQDTTVVTGKTYYTKDTV